MGLVNRVVPAGDALRAALELAAELAALPQTCMRNDRLSMLEGLDLPEDEAIRNEVAHGQRSFSTGEASAGISSFSAGAGRHGRPRRGV